MVVFLVVSTSDAAHIGSIGACAYCVAVICALSIMARWIAGHGVMHGL